MAEHTNGTGDGIARLAEEARRFTREQEATRQKIQLEEQTTLTRRESEQRLQVQAARVEQEMRLEKLRQSQAEAIERVRLDTDASARQKTLQVEQALQELAADAAGGCGNNDHVVHSRPGRRKAEGPIRSALIPWRYE